MSLIAERRTWMPRLDPLERRHGFAEVARGYTPAQAVAEAQRCLLCQEPACEAGCPVHVPIRDFVARLADGEFEAAARRIEEVTPLASICGRVCPQEDQCEKACVLRRGGLEPVAIGRLERFVGDWRAEHPAPPGRTGGPAGRNPARGGGRAGRVAVVGSGPAGLTAAGELARAGCQVTVFEALHEPGGVLTYGIPEFRLPKEIVRQNVERLRAMGVEIVTDVVIGRSLTVAQLRQEMGYDAVFLGTGAGLPRFLEIPGEELNGVLSANEFLTRVNLMKAYRFPEYDTPVHVGRRVAVIGAGNTAMDAVRTALRLGAEEAHILYRRTEAEMTARAEEYEHAREEGVLFHWLVNPTRFLGDDQGWLRAVELQRMELGEPDATGRRRPVPVAGALERMEIETAIIAVGTTPNPLIGRTTPGLVTGAHGEIRTGADGETSVEGIFAGGDIVTGAATVIEAMGAGQRAARAILRYLEARAATRTA